MWGPSKMGLKTNPGRCWLFLVTYEVREGFFQNVDCSKDGGDDAGPLWAEMWCYYPFGGCRHILGPRGRWLWHAVGDHEEGWRHFRLPASPLPFKPQKSMSLNEKTKCTKTCKKKNELKTRLEHLRSFFTLEEFSNSASSFLVKNLLVAVIEVGVHVLLGASSEVLVEYTSEN